MLFFYNRVLLAAIIAFSFLQFTFASPIPKLWVPSILLYELRAKLSEIFLPNYRRVEHSVSSRQEIAGFGLSEEHAREVKNWHDNHVIHAMRTDPLLKGKAHSAIIQYVSTFNYHWIYRSFISSHTAHQRGSDPNEKNHITASFYDKHGQVIHNNYNGGVCIILHLYNEIDL